MTAIVFTPSPAPSFPLSDAHKPKVDLVNFGDGYTQRVKSEINNDMEQITLTWENLTQTEFDTIWAFFVARGGVEPFTYTMPFSGAGSAKLYFCSTFQRDKGDAGVYKITANLQQTVEAA